MRKLCWALACVLMVSLLLAGTAMAEDCRRLNIHRDDDDETHWWACDTCGDTDRIYPHLAVCTEQH